MMKALLTVVLSIMCLVGSVAAFHGEEQLCEKCHVMHYSENGAPAQPDGGPFEHLLVRERSTQVCLTCHEKEKGMPDVVGNDVNGLRNRAAGFFAGIDVENPHGHNLQLDETGPSDLCSSCHSGGDFNSAQIGCIDCHDPHGGNGSYRYLRSASDPENSPKIKAFVNPSAAGLQVYEQENVGYVAPAAKVSDWREVTNICFGCHHRFSGDGYTRNTSGSYIRHPSTDSERGLWDSINKGGMPQSDIEHWKNGTGQGFAIDRVPFIVSGAANYSTAKIVASQGGGVTNQVFCLSCHKAHGSDYNNALRWPSDSSLGCQQCHNKG